MWFCQKQHLLEKKTAVKDSSKPVKHRRKLFALRNWTIFLKSRSTKQIVPGILGMKIFEGKTI
jgi:hypothetical protein